MWFRPVGSPRWSVGVAWYGGDALLWYRALSLSVRPQQRLCRADFRVQSQRSAGRDDLALPGDVVVLECRTDEGPRELAMEPSTLTGSIGVVLELPNASGLLEKVGVTPDIVVEPTWAQLRAGEDPALDAAVEAVLAGVSP